MRRLILLSLLTTVLTAGGVAATDGPARMTTVVLPVERVAGWTCKRASSCAEAVREWCGGYARADGDGDGIPCENVCSSLSEVNRIRRQIGC